MTKPISVLPLAIFRIGFGLLMFVSQIRFLMKGWVEELYLAPSFHFTFPGFHWVQPLLAFWMYFVVILTGLLALFIALGLFYRWATVGFFLCFTYLELIDIAWYLNHYYFISLVAFLLIFVPAHKYFSLDNYFFRKNSDHSVFKWQINVFKWQLALVYIFAGLAKIKYDWLVLAQPMKIWLAAKSDFPIIGGLFEYEVTAYAFSWFGMLYDCTIPFFLWNKKTRPWAFIAVVVFHGLTWALFPIGMFPWIMIVASLIFFDAGDWGFLSEKLKVKNEKYRVESEKFEVRSSDSKSQILNLESQISNLKFQISNFLFALYFLIQLALPLRQYFYKGNPLWTELGYRFAWNVMLVEKTGYCHFNVKDQTTGKQWTVQPSSYLNRVQEKQMSYQPDMIWQFAYFLKEEYSETGVQDISIKVYNKVSMNGHKSQFLLDPNADLLEIKSVADLPSILLTLDPQF